MLVDVFIHSSKSLSTFMFRAIMPSIFDLKKKDVKRKLMLRLLRRDEVYHLSLFLNSSRAQ